MITVVQLSSCLTLFVGFKKFRAPNRLPSTVSYGFNSTAQQCPLSNAVLRLAKGLIASNQSVS